MKYPLVKPKPPAPADEAGVYASLDDLARLQFRATGFSFLPRQPVHSLLTGRHASRLRGRGLNFEELRRYLPGDDIRNMDWHVTARTRKPYVRVYSEERDRPLLLVVDQRVGMFFGSRRAMKSVAAAEAAALAAWRALHVGDRVGAIVFDDRGSDEFVPRRSRQQVMRILQSIVTKNRALSASADVPTGSGALNAALERATQLAKHDFLVCLVSDAAGADQETVRHVTTLCEHNDVISVFVYDPLEVQLPNAGRLVAAHGDAELEFNSSDAGLRAKFHGDFQERAQRIAQLSREREIPVLPLSAAEDVATQLRAVLGHRQSGRRR
jgi:uncharacterized protein (DUF58 family)